MVRADVDGESIGQLPMSVTVLPFHLRWRRIFDGDLNIISIFNPNP